MLFLEGGVTFYLIMTFLNFSVALYMVTNVYIRFWASDTKSRVSLVSLVTGKI